MVTAPDRKAGRGQQLQPCRVKEAALELGLPIAQPEKLRASEFLDQLKAWNADLFAVVAFRMLPEVVWSMPPKGTVNVHGSLLPDFRGAAPIQHAIAAGEERTGVTSFFITRDIDTGGLLLQRSTPVTPQDTAGSVYGRLMKEGAGLMVDTADALAHGPLDGVPQDALLRGDERDAPSCSAGRTRRPAEITSRSGGLHSGHDAVPWCLDDAQWRHHEDQGTRLADSAEEAPAGLAPVSVGSKASASGSALGW